MWLSRSFSFTLAFQLVTVTGVGSLALIALSGYGLPTLEELIWAILLWPPIYVYAAGIFLWIRHHLAQIANAVEFNRRLWTESLVLTSAAICYFLGSDPQNLSNPTFLALMILPTYLMLIVTVGFVRTFLT